MQRRFHPNRCRLSTHVSYHHHMLHLPHEAHIKNAQPLLSSRSPHASSPPALQDAALRTPRVVCAAYSSGGRLPAASTTRCQRRPTPSPTSTTATPHVQTSPSPHILAAVRAARQPESLPGRCVRATMDQGLRLKRR